MKSDGDIDAILGRIEGKTKYQFTSRERKLRNADMPQDKKDELKGFLTRARDAQS